MGRPEGWMAERLGRASMRSPGRPPALRREHRQQFWELVGQGVSSEDAGVRSGVSPAVGSRLFRHAGGMCDVSKAALSDRYLSFVEREEVALLRAQGMGVRAIALRLRSSASTISRELRRNAASQAGLQRSVTPVRTGPPRWHGHASRRHTCGSPCRYRVEGAPSRAQAGPEVGERVEPGADRRASADRFPR
jgi:hypothetical protein